MENVRKIKFESKPEAIESLHDGTYYYNYNITPVMVMKHSMESGKEEEVQMFEAVQVMLRGKANYADCVRAIIREYVSVDDEFDIINTANKAIMAGETPAEYQEYLNLVNEIKTKVKADFE